MIIAKAPLRMSFIGGGTDLPIFYRNHGGLVISTTIDKYIYVSINKKFDDHIRLSYSITENCKNVNELRHPIVRNILSYYGNLNGIEITSVADIPSGGTGLGSSSTFTVALITVINAYLGKYIPAQEVARQACQIEIDMCGEPIGKQDQYAAAFGGLNLYEFHKDESVTVSPLNLDNDFLRDLEKKIICFYTGDIRSASRILDQQRSNLLEDENTVESLLLMKQLTSEFLNELRDQNIVELGKILDHSWAIKRKLAGGITNQIIDHYYNQAIKSGAWGGKILGAGGGGFLMFLAPESCHYKIESSLQNLRKIPLPFSNECARIIFSD